MVITQCSVSLGCAFLSTRGCWESHYLITTQSLYGDLSPLVDMNNRGLALSDREDQSLHSVPELKNLSRGFLIIKGGKSGQILTNSKFRF